MERKIKILLVEDDRHLSELMQEYLQENDFEVLVEARGDSAPERILENNPDLLILDLMLPGRDGLSVCQAVRAHYLGPILILTAREDDMDQVAGLEMGADDYVKKPIEPRVLLARIRALLRRYRAEVKRDSTCNGPGKREELVFGDLIICTTSRSVSLNGTEIELGSSEFDLLLLLARNAGVVLDRDRISSELRGIPYDGLDRFVDVNILRLRKKLEIDPSRPKRIKTIWRQGYLFVGNGWRESSS